MSVLSMDAIRHTRATSYTEVKNAKMNRVIGELHALYYSVLWRCADADAVDSFLASPVSTWAEELDRVKREITSSSEAKCVAWYKSYLKQVAKMGRSVSSNNGGNNGGNNGDNNEDNNEVYHNMAANNAVVLVQVFVQKLCYLPRKTDYLKFLAYSSSRSKPLTEEAVLIYLKDNNDFKYLEQCRRHFYGLAEPGVVEKSGDRGRQSDETVVVARVRYYGPVGTSGYAKVGHNIARALSLTPGVEVQFVPAQFHNYRESDDADNVLLSKLAQTRFSRVTPEEVKDHEKPRHIVVPSHVIIHSPPDLWPAICAAERAKNPGVIIYGITVWEAERLPYQWSTYVRFVDRVSVPSTFSAKAFESAGIPVDVVHHPIDGDDESVDPKGGDKMGNRMKTDPSDRCMLYRDGLRARYSYVFYNISEWTNRKGLTDLISAFTRRFYGRTDVLLYVKTHGDVSEAEADDFVLASVEAGREKERSGAVDASRSSDDEAMGSNTGDEGRRILHHNVVLDYERVSDAYIDDIHRVADCYVSLCKSEGHGVGACYAALFGNPVIITGYGGQTDYLQGDDVSFVRYDLEPACYCTTWSKKHRRCGLLPHCRYFNGFVPAIHVWARPDVDHCLLEMERVLARSLDNRDREKGYALLSSNRASDFIKTRFDARSCGSALKRSLLETTKQRESERYEYVSAAIREDEQCAASSEASSLFLPQRHFYDFEGPSKKGKKRARVLVVASYGYGNVGDDSYGELIRYAFRQSEKDVELAFCPDSCLLLADGTYRHVDKFMTDDAISKRTPEFVAARYLASFDYLIVGGGGLLSRERLRNKTHNSIWFYTELFARTGKPYYIISVGFQDIECRHKSDDIKGLHALKGMLDGAQLVSVRSVVDYKLAADIMSDGAPFLCYHPDMAYSFGRVFPSVLPDDADDDHRQDRGRDVVMVVATSTWVNVKRTVVVADVLKHVREGDELVFANWGGVAGDGRDLSGLYPDDVRETFPGATIFPGIMPAWDWIARKDDGSRNATLRDVWRLLRRTRVLFTGRYHGVVLGKAAGVPKVETYGYTNYKFEADRMSLHPLMDAASLDTASFVPLDNVKRIILTDKKKKHREWKDHDRNTAIVNLHNVTGIDVEMLQNWKNDRLEECLQER